MKILYIVTQADLGGAQRSVLLLAAHFNGEIASGIEKSELFNEAQKKNIPTHKIKFLKRGIRPISDFLAFWEIYLLIKKLRPDIVHLNSSKAGFLGSLAGKLAGAKVIFTARGFVFNEPRNRLFKLFFITLEKIASIFRDQIITVSKFDEASALKFKLINPQKVTTIHNAIPSIEFLDRKTARLNLGINEDKFIVGTIANFYSTKGLDVLIDTVAKLSPEILNKIQIVLIGSGPQEKKLKLLTTTYNLEPFFIFAGQIPNASSYLKALDIFVLPSRKEGFPLVLLEAMQAGLPIIATDVGGNKEALGDAGVIVPSGNGEILAEALENLINNPDHRNRLAEKARERSKIFTLEKLFSETENIYKKILQS
jgi:glycosyltransferase involved in cell wall biosynthesis